MDAGSSSEAPLIRYNNVSVSFNDRTVLHEVNFEVHKGEIIYLLGRVGSGKSSLLRSFYADTMITNGSASVLNHDLVLLDEDEIPFLRRQLGIVFQDFKLLGDRNVEANLEFVLRATDVKDPVFIQNRIQQVLDFVDMSNKGYKMPFELSGGEQQRIVIARALINKPQIILADEPTGNLDMRTGEELMKLIYHIVEEGTSVVMATHNLRWVQKFSGRVCQCVNDTLVELPADKVENLSPADIYYL